MADATAAIALATGDIITDTSPPAQPVRKRWPIVVVEAALAFLLLGMVVMVFGNVVLRYLFNSNIVVSEELSRYFFIWLTFVGAVLAIYEGTHLGVDNLVRKLSRRGRIVCLGASEAMILVVGVLILHGAWQQHDVNATSFAPVTGLSMIWVFGIAYLIGAAMVAHAATKLFRIATGLIRDDELIEVRSESDAGN
ncbi:MAG: TRAP transporter small permease [Lautropia sp.]